MTARVNGDLHALLSVAGVIFVSLTFFHPVMWGFVGLVLGAAMLLLTPPLLKGSQPEPPAFFVALTWVGLVVAVAVSWGLTENLYNIRQVVLVLGGLLLGYFLSLRPVAPLAAWAPFAAFACFFAAMLVAGWDPNRVFTRNSQNYISVILLALYTAAVIMTRPATARASHLAAAGIVLAISIWAAGRGGILASLLLTGGLGIKLAIQRRTGLTRLLIAIAALLLGAAAIYVGAIYLDQAGYLYKFEGRGLHDASRLTILTSYFENIRVSELLLGRNYYDNSVIGRWGFNLHNSYLDSWAHLGLLYLLFVGAVLLLVLRHRKRHAVLAIAFLAFAARAITDSQLLTGQYDFVFFAALFLLLRDGRNSRAAETPEPRASIAETAT